MGEDRQNSRSVKMALKLMMLMVARWVKSNLHRRRPIEFEVRMLQKFPNKEYKCRQQILIFFSSLREQSEPGGEKRSEAKSRKRERDSEEAKKQVGDRTMMYCQGKKY